MEATVSLTPTSFPILFGVSDLRLLTEYTQSHCRAQHIMRIIHQYLTFVSISLEEQESLEGHSLYPFSFSAYDQCFLRQSLPAGFGFSNYITCIAIGSCTQIDLPDQPTLSPSLESDYDYDLH